MLSRMFENATNLIFTIYIIPGVILGLYGAYQLIVNLEIPYAYVIAMLLVTLVVVNALMYKEPQPKVFPVKSFTDGIPVDISELKVEVD